MYYLSCKTRTKLSVVVTIFFPNLFAYYLFGVTV